MTREPQGVSEVVERVRVIGVGVPSGNAWTAWRRIGTASAYLPSLISSTPWAFSAVPSPEEAEGSAGSAGAGAACSLATDREPPPAPEPPPSSTAAFPAFACFFPPFPPPESPPVSAKPPTTRAASTTSASAHPIRDRPERAGSADRDSSGRVCVSRVGGVMDESAAPRAEAPHPADRLTRPPSPAGEPDPRIPPASPRRIHRPGRPATEPRAPGDRAAAEGRSAPHPGVTPTAARTRPLRAHRRRSPARRRPRSASAPAPCRASSRSPFPRRRSASFPSRAQCPGPASLDRPVVANQDLRRLDPTANDAGPMGAIQAGRHPAQDRDHLLGIHRAGRRQLLPTGRDYSITISAPSSVAIVSTPRQVGC